MTDDSKPDEQGASPVAAPEVPENAAEPPEEPTIADQVASMVPAPVAQALERIPDAEARETIERSIVAMSWGGRPPNPFDHKVTGAHIDKMLELQSSDMHLTFKDRSESRRWLVLCFGISVLSVVFVVLALALNGQAAVLGQIFPYVALIAGGFGGGYGFAEWRHRNE